MDKNPWFRALIVILVFIAALYLGGLLYQLASRFGEIILLFFLSWLLAFSLNPIARVLMRRGIPRVIAAILIYVGLLFLGTSLVIMAVPGTAAQLYQLGQALPGFVQDAPATVTSVQLWLQQLGMRELDLSSIFANQSMVSRAESIGTLLAQNALGIAQGAASAVFNLVIILILSFYFMMDGDRIASGFLSLLPERYRQDARFFFDCIARSFGGFLRGTTILATIYGLGTAVIMWQGGLDYIALASIFAGAVMIVPLFGTILAIIPPILLSAFTSSWENVVLVTVALLVLQQIVLNVVSPKLMAESVGIHPLLVFLAMLIGLREAGIWGAIFGVPIMSVIYTVALSIHERISPSQSVRETVTEEDRRVPVLSGQPEET